MKVTEIISPVNEEWYKPSTWFNSSTPAAPTASRPAVRPASIPSASPVATAVAAVTPKEQAAALKNIKKDPAAYLKVINKRIAAGEFSKDIAAAQKTGISRMGIKWWNVLKFLGFATACYELWAHLAAVDADYMAGKYTGKNPDPTGLTRVNPATDVEFNEQDYKDWRRFYIGLWEAQVLLPLVVAIIKKVADLLFITRAIVGVLAAMGSVATLGGTLLGFATTELLTQAIQAWLISPAGQEWAVKNLFGPLVLAGEIGEDAWLILYKGVSGIKKAVKSGDINDITKGDNFYADKKAERAKDPELAKRDAAMGTSDVKTGTNSVIVGGQRITDKDGYLLPGMDFQSDVKMAIEYNPAEKAKYDAVVAKGKAPKKSGEGNGSFDSMSPTKYIGNDGKLGTFQKGKFTPDTK